MKEQLEECLVVLAHSYKTQVALFFGVLFFLAVNLVGVYVAGNMELEFLGEDGSKDVARAFAERLHELALVQAIGFVWVAVLCYKKDRDRLFR